MRLIGERHYLLNVGEFLDFKRCPRGERGHDQWFGNPLFTRRRLRVEWPRLLTHAQFLSVCWRILAAVPGLDDLLVRDAVVLGRFGVVAPRRLGLCLRSDFFLHGDPKPDAADAK